MLEWKSAQIVYFVDEIAAARLYRAT